MPKVSLNIFKCHWRAWIAVGAAIVMLLTVWMADRIDMVADDGDTGMKYIRIAQLVAGMHDEPIPSDILAINIGYDRQLTEICDEYGMPMGKIDVTDRDALRRFCEAVKGAAYKSVVLDVFFDKKIPAEGDSALFDAINALDRLVIPLHADGSLNPGIDIGKGASGDYTVTYEQSNFVKYPFFGVSGIPSMALAAYRHEVKPDNGEKSNFGKSVFVQSSPILSLPIVPAGPYGEDNEKTWYNLTADILDCYTPSEIAKLVKGKHVVVGDYTTADFHETYVGTLPGPLLHINALVALQRNQTTVKPLSVLFLFVGYFLICRFIASGWTLWRFFPWKPKRFVGFLLGFIGFSTALMAMQVIGFIVFGEFHDFWLITLFLSAYTLLCQYLNQKFPLCQPTTV